MSLRVIVIIMLFSAIGDDNYTRPKRCRLSKRTQNGLHGKIKQVKLIGAISRHGALLDKRMKARWSVRESISIMRKRRKMKMRMAGMLALTFNSNHKGKSDTARIAHPLYTPQ